MNPDSIELYISQILKNKICVLHAFRKKTQKIRLRDIEFSRVALRKLLERKT